MSSQYVNKLARCKPNYVWAKWFGQKSFKADLNIDFGLVEAEQAYY